MQAIQRLSNDDEHIKTEIFEILNRKIVKGNVLKERKKLKRFQKKAKKEDVAIEKSGKNVNKIKKNSYELKLLQIHTLVLVIFSSYVRELCANVLHVPGLFNGSNFLAFIVCVNAKRDLGHESCDRKYGQLMNLLDTCSNGTLYYVWFYSKLNKFQQKKMITQLS